MLKYALMAIAVAGPAIAEDVRWCAGPRDHNCREDIHLKARLAMEEKMHACWQLDNVAEFASCVDAAGWRTDMVAKGIIGDDRFKPLIVFRK